MNLNGIVGDRKGSYIGGRGAGRVCLASAGTMMSSPHEMMPILIVFYEK
jgi:hypothetical protein